MTALTDNTRYRTHEPGRANPEVFNAEVLYAGAFVSIGNENHATSEAPGRAEAWSNAAGRTPAGWSQDQQTGDTSASPIVRGHIDTQPRQVECSVTGAAGDETDVLKLVYATDDQTFTLTRPSDPTTPVGFIVDYRASGSALVEFFGLREQVLLSLAGGSRHQLTIPVGVGLTTSGNLATGYLAPCHGKITSVYGICLIGPTDADVDIDANVEIGGTNVTGGVVEMVTADVAGDKKAGTAVTAANVFHAGDAIDIEGTVNTAGTVTDPGLYLIVIEYVALPGL